MQTVPRILITGASGMGATGIRPLLRKAGYRLVLLDVAEVPDLRDGEVFHRASITDSRALDRALDGVDLVVHLGGFSRETEWANILQTNIDGTQKVLEAAHHAGVRRVLLASSMHAIGFWPANTPTNGLSPRPDTYYGVSKIAAEALGSVFADRFGMTIVSARIGTFADEPSGERHRRTWLSYADLVRLVEAVATTEVTGHHVIYATSANTRRWFPLENGYVIGYNPEDNAEAWGPYSTTETDADSELIGGAFTTDAFPLGESS